MKVAHSTQNLVRREKSSRGRIFDALNDVSVRLSGKARLVLEVQLVQA